ncbi:hypothetical protein [Pontibacter flavimaris]|uniref:Lipoprotein n=1 Tax=Pontibacter flavimaris TaxID=1797110 RepID=A0A1Q5PGT6_9BACT|nr:hypothetical protein [Pontibacter flavimaris]OKL41445.1 hypothetical protein A3841_10350 [Pontibacter flavimaris]
MFFHVRARQFVLPLLLGFTAVACKTVTEVAPKVAEEPATVYTIKKGAHYSDKNNVRKLTTSRIRFEVTFDSTAIYTSVKPNNQADINKLYGLSDCNTSHHTNSARFGWRWYNNRLEVLAYTYLNKKWEYKLLGSVPLGQKVALELRMEEGNYVFEMLGKEVDMPRACNGAAEGYQLYPYFGGDETAPHDITIRIKDLK